VNSPRINPNTIFESLPDFRMKIVRDFDDQASKLMSRPSPYYGTISLSRPLSLADRKFARKKGGWHSTLSRRMSGQEVAFSELVAPLVLLLHWGSDQLLEVVRFGSRLGTTGSE